MRVRAKLTPRITILGVILGVTFKLADFQQCWRRESAVLAEREGFEPPVPLSTVVFKTTVIDHSTISPVLRLLESGCKGTEFFRIIQILSQLFIIYLVI